MKMSEFGHGDEIDLDIIAELMREQAWARRYYLLPRTTVGGQLHRGWLNVQEPPPFGFRAPKRFATDIELFELRLQGKTKT